MTNVRSTRSRDESAAVGPALLAQYKVATGGLQEDGSAAGRDPAPARRSRLQAELDKRRGNK